MLFIPPMPSPAWRARAARGAQARRLAHPLPVREDRIYRCVLGRYLDPGLDGWEPMAVSIHRQERPALPATEQRIPGTSCPAHWTSAGIRGNSGTATMAARKDPNAMANLRDGGIAVIAASERIARQRPPVVCRPSRALDEVDSPRLQASGLRTETQTSGPRSLSWTTDSASRPRRQ